MTKTKLAVVGCSSMVGSRFCELTTKDFELINADLFFDPKIDITDKKSVDNFFQNDFEWLILFSAFTDVDEAEKQRGDKNGLCWNINVRGVENITNACQAHNRNLVFISTDFIFDGENGPHSEDDLPGPNLEKVSWYGITKIEGEKIVKSLGESTILRISYPYRASFPAKEDFARSILKKYKEGSLYPMFRDQIITPTFIDDLAPAVSLLIRKNLGGIFHLASPVTTTPYDFAKYLILTFTGKNPDIDKAKLEELLRGNNVTPRPIKGGMIVDKIKSMGFYPTDWKEGIKKVYEQSGGKLMSL